MPKRNQLTDVFKHYDLTGGLNDGQIHPERCWLWRSAVNGNGQPTFSYNGKSYYAYRIVYHVAYPDKFQLDDPRIIRHVECDNNLCGNYNHMAPGSHQDNMNDAVEHSRFGLTKEILSDIMDLSVRTDLTHQRIAERVSYKHKINVARSTVTDVINGRRKQRRKEQKDDKS